VCSEAIHISDNIALKRFVDSAFAATAPASVYANLNRDHAMSDSENENKARNREIAENEAERQTIGDIRVSGWAIAVAVIIGLAAVGWVLIHNR
jgi:hypothetical protein